MNPLLLRRRSSRKYVPNKHRYWAIRAVTLQTGGAVSFTVAEIEMRATAGGADQCSGGTPSASTTLAGTAASNGFDNNTGTVWSSTTADAVKRISYDFGSAVNVNEVLLTSSASVITQNALTLIVESSDNGTVWTTQWQYTKMANWTIGEARTLTRPAFSDVRTLWRLLYTVNYIGIGNGFASFVELSIASSIGGSNLANSGNISSDTDFDGSHTVTNLVDSNTATFWTSLSGYPHWTTFTASSDLTVMEWKTTARSDGGTNHQLTPATIILQHSLDSKTWVDVKQGGYATITSGEVKTFQFIPPFAFVAA